MSKEKEIREKDILNHFYNRPETIVIDDDSIRDSIIARIEDLSNLSCKEFCNKYGVTDRTYRNWKRHAVTIYNVDPRRLYSESRIKELSAYEDDEKVNLPIAEQVAIPSSVEKIGNYISERKTIQIKGDGTIERIWLKTKLENEKFFEATKQAILDICREKVKPAPIIKKPKITNEDLLTFYPLPDLHWGMLICQEEVNHRMNYDLKIAKDWFETSISYLVDRSPNSSIAVITDLGDFLHSSDDTNRTKHGNVLDVDQRHSKIVRIAFESMYRMIEEALKKHEFVYFYSVPGNHSEYIPIYLKEFLRAWFRNNKRVIIPDGNRAQQYHVFGKCIIGFTHGHELKPERCSEVIVSDNKSVFSQSNHCYMHFGHFHSYRAFNTPLVNIEIHNNLPPRDRWAESMGFRGNIGVSKAIVYHKEYGELNRITFNLPLEEPSKIIS